MSKTKLERGGRRKLNAKEREKQLNKNTRIVDEMMYELESKVRRGNSTQRNSENPYTLH